MLGCCIRLSRIRCRIGSPLRSFQFWNLRLSPDPQKDLGGDPVCGLDLVVLKAYRIGKIERLKQQAEPLPAPCPASLRVDMAGQRGGQKCPCSHQQTTWEQYSVMLPTALSHPPSIAPCILALASGGVEEAEIATPFL